MASFAVVLLIHRVLNISTKRHALQQIYTIPMFLWNEQGLSWPLYCNFDISFLVSCSSRTPPCFGYTVGFREYKQVSQSCAKHLSAALKAYNTVASLAGHTPVNMADSMENADSWTVSGSQEAMEVLKNFKDL